MLKTIQVCDLVGKPYYVIAHMIRARLIPQPARDASGDYCFSPEDVENVRRVLASRQRPAEVQPA